MGTNRPTSESFALSWSLTWIVPVAAQLLLSVVLSEAGISGSPTILFWLVIVAASCCALTSTAVLVRAHRRQEVELGYIGLFFLAVSVLPLVHGIATPYVLYDENHAAVTAAQWSVPAALALGAPLLLPARCRRAAQRLWPIWSVAGLTLLLGSSALLLLEPNVMAPIGPGTLPAMVIGVLATIGCIALGHRHRYLAQVAGSRLPLIVSMGFGFVGASSLVWFGAAPYSIGFWVAHGLDISGVFAGTIGALVVLRSTSSVRSMIEPVLAAEPLAALELGLEPIVHDFVADLEASDQITRDHVIRTAELAIKVGTELGFDGRELRQLGLAALLHDVGKLDIPAAIIKKPDRLTDDEYVIMKRHAAFGQALVERSPALADIGPFIRAHHERMDGDGYPDGRSGQAIPLIARIVAVCDSYDAMANTRQYRHGMGVDKALAILREHAGTQWDPTVVAAAERVIRRDPRPDTPAFEAVGRLDDAEDVVSEAPVIGCDCLPAGAVASQT